MRIGLVGCAVAFLSTTEIGVAHAQTESGLTMLAAARSSIYKPYDDVPRYLELAVRMQPMVDWAVFSAAAALGTAERLAAPKSNSELAAIADAHTKLAKLESAWGMLSSPTSSSGPMATIGMTSDSTVAGYLALFESRIDLAAKQHDMQAWYRSQADFSAKSHGLASWGSIAAMSDPEAAFSDAEFTASQISTDGMEGSIQSARAAANRAAAIAKLDSLSAIILVASDSILAKSLRTMPPYTAASAAYRQDSSAANKAAYEEAGRARTLATMATIRVFNGAAIWHENYVQTQVVKAAQIAYGADSSEANKLAMTQAQARLFDMQAAFGKSRNDAQNAIGVFNRRDSSAVNRPAPSPPPIPTGTFGFGIECSGCKWIKDAGAASPRWTFGPSATIAQVDSGGPAAKAGIKNGDRIVALDGIPIEDDAAGRIFSVIVPSTVVRWTLDRKGTRFTVSLTAYQRSQTGTPQTLRYSGTVNGSKVEVRGTGGVVVTPDPNGKGLTVSTTDLTVQVIKP